MAYVHSQVTNVTLEHHWRTQEMNTFTDFIQTVLACVPTYAAVERLFSVADALKTAKRSRLSPKNLSNIMIKYNQTD